MANNDTTTPELSTRSSPDGKEPTALRAGEGASAAEVVKESPGATTTTTSPSSVSAQSSTETAPQPQPSVQQPRPSLVPLGSSQSSPSTQISHPKKFSAVNVNKKFLEKTAQAASAATAPSTSSSTKSSAAVARPATTSTASHSRLVTAKLTAAPISSTAGWSRPASVAPSTSANNSPNSTSPLPTSATASNPSSAAPQLPHVGKVIQPQPKNVVGASPSSTNATLSGGKPVWGNLPSAPVRLGVPVDDFPTAAEVAKGSIPSTKKTKAEENKATAEAVKQARLEDADAFRGVHLDPNAHHWDEMEEDDDDFLGGVVEFGDGRQYKVESVDGAPSGLSPGPKPLDGAENVRDRFVDDFDRSWPKSKSSPAVLSQDLPPNEITRSPTTSVNGLHPTTSPTDSSRVLFNERSNRLEPYSRQGQPPISKRQGFQDDGRPYRDFSGPPSNVQVLHKPPPSDFGVRNRRFSSASNTSSGPPPSPRENHFPRRDGPPSSPRMTRDLGHMMAPSTSHGGRDRDGGRRSNMGPPPVPPRALKSALESGRQLPPHLTQQPPVRREPRPLFNDPPTPASVKAPSLPSQSPLLSNAQLSAISPVIASVAGLPLPAGADLEEVRKDVMHTAAARAKQRREQEEAEREAQKERARRKAQELEEKMKAAELEKARQKEKEAAGHESQKPPQPIPDDLINSIIQEAVKSAQVGDSQRGRLEPLLSGAPSSTTGEISSHPPQNQSPSAAKSESWRSNVPAPALQQRRSSSGFVASATTALDVAVETRKEDLEIVDFSDMGKLMGTQSQRGQHRDIGDKPPRPVASDFFEDKKPATELEKTEPLTWRRKLSTSPPRMQEVTLPDHNKEEDGTANSISSPPKENPSPRRQSTVERPTTPTAKDFAPSQEQANNRNVNILPSSPSTGLPRTPRSQAFYKEATMSSLDDTMSRIKGAIVHMKIHEVPNPPPPEHHAEPSQARTSAVQIPLKPPFREKWIPPARRRRPAGLMEDEDREVFDATVVALTHSPPPSPLRVQVPTQSRPLELINRRQLHLFHRPPQPARFDVLSFEPPVEGMNKRDFSVNDILFRKPVYFKGKPKYRVALPRLRQTKTILRAFGKPLVADNTASWRKLPVGPEHKPPSPTVDDQYPADTGLETMSRSPPPGISGSEVTIASIPKPADPVPSKSESQPAVRSRPQPKMPAGSAVAVMRDSKIDVIEGNVKSLVNFIVSDELEETRESAQTMEDLPSDIPESNSLSNGLSSQQRTPSPISKPAASPQIVSNKHESGLLPLTSEAKSPETNNPTERVTFQPPSHQTSPWSRSTLTVPPLKESTSRGPDPEHLKALWSQPPEKSELHPVNSLEGISDDLTSLPFTLHEVKSEDGATPPPPAPQPPPSRMSLHDVTRAFQQVPQSSSTNSARPPISPPSTNAPVARPTTNYAPYNHLPPNGMRPSYGPYSSSSPVPGMGMMYSHPQPMASGSPVPGRMQVNPAHPPSYSQSMWIPILGTPAPASNMMRPYGSPQVMPYNVANNGYPQHTAAPPNPMQHHHHPVPQNGMQPNRNRTMPMSPALAHPPMYPTTSPMLMHAHAHPPVMQVPQNHGYPMPAARGQSRADNGPHPGQHPAAGQQQAHMYPPPAPSAPFTRW